MNAIDITGTIENGMWTYGPPWPETRIEKIPQPDWVPWRINAWQFTFAGQCGTYLQTGLHFRNEDPPLIDVPVERLVNRPAVVLRVPGKKAATDVITPDDLEACGADIRQGDAIIVSIDWDRKWHDPDYVSSSPYYTKAGMDWLLDHKPFLIAGDWPKWENVEEPQNIFDRFFAEGVLLLAPVVNLDAVQKQRVKLTVLPIKIAETCHTPARAVVIED